jgi:hypothetical protein
MNLVLFASGGFCWRNTPSKSEQATSERQKPRIFTDATDQRGLSVKIHGISPNPRCLSSQSPLFRFSRSAGEIQRFLRRFWFTGLIFVFLLATVASPVAAQSQQPITVTVIQAVAARRASLNFSTRSALSTTRRTVTTRPAPSARAAST